MSTKDFNAIAAILAGSFANDRTGAIWCLTLSLADYFQSVNPNFNRGKFYAAVMGDSDHFAARDRLSLGTDLVKRMFDNETI
jgi:hypothetical protein